MDKFITVGVAGHVDHGKTSLVKVLTGIDTDRLGEEKRRGLSIEPSVAPWRLPSGKRIALVDVPGHSDFLKNTIRGLSSVDMAILIVAADDGVMPQTRDHLAVLNFFDAKGGFIVLSKTDLVDQETISIAESEIREAVQNSFLNGKPIVHFSAMDGRGVDQIVHAAESESERIAGKRQYSPFRLWIDQVRSFSGFGTVVSGTVFSGQITDNDAVQILPSGMDAKVRFLEVHHERVSRAVAGQRVGVNIQGISVQEVNAGMALIAPGAYVPASMFNAKLSILQRVRAPLVNQQRVNLYIGTQCVKALVVMMEQDRLRPGESGLVQLRIQEPLPVLPGDSYVISGLNSVGIMGGGNILETTREKFRAVKKEKNVSYLRALGEKDVSKVTELFLLKYANRPVSAEEIASSGLPIEKIEAEVKSKVKTRKLIVLEGRGYFPRNDYETLIARLMDVTKEILAQDSYKMLVKANEIRYRLDPALDEFLFERMLRELCTQGKLLRCDGGYQIPTLVGKLSPNKRQLIEKLKEFAASQGYSSFSAGTFHKLHGEGIQWRDVQKALDYMHAQKKIVRLNDGRYLTCEALQEIGEKVRTLIQQKGSLTIKDAAEILGYGRLRAVPVLDYLDTIGLTRRVADSRVLMSGDDMMPERYGMRGRVPNAC
ncbi:MAG: selenocysteine-specific translation elongation factor [Desulfomonilaceae bacterium]|jgi:selenocysteine-specific elongation factor